MAPSLKYLGVMLPYTPLHHLLLRETGLPLVMTSGNLSEEPIARDNDEALRRLGRHRRLLSGAQPRYLRPLRRQRHAWWQDKTRRSSCGAPAAMPPTPSTSPSTPQQILACGAEEKNTFCLTRDNYAFVSQHIGDMENVETLEHFERTIELL